MEANDTASPPVRPPDAETIMAAFAAATGLTAADRRPRRYLWTDAFAVCNFLGLYRQTGRERYRDLALDLVAQVHDVLGRHRPDDPRQGWLSGLDEARGREHPTAGGLRIGKPRKERPPGAAPDDEGEWHRDGQYFHYLVQWMHALDRAGHELGDARFNRWGRELARTAHARFIRRAAGGAIHGLSWKMSIDLARPLVPAMGHHDPLEGFVTFLQLQTSAAGEPDLGPAIADMARLCEGRDWGTDDPLGLGGLLTCAWKAARLAADRQPGLPELAVLLLEAARPGMEGFAGGNPLGRPAGRRLAFRELGLAIGLAAVERLQGMVARRTDIFTGRHPIHAPLETLARFTPLKGWIERFWLEKAHRQVPTWTDHRDINRVMLATSLAPDGYLGRSP